MKNHGNLNSLEKRINKLKKQQTLKKSMQYTSKGAELAIEVVAAMITGMIVGVSFDKLFNSYPVCLTIGMILGCVIVLRLIWKEGYNTNA